MSSSSSGVTEDEIAHWRSYIGRCETRRQWLDVESLRRFAVAVGSDPDVEDHPPPLAHWAYFLEAAPSSAIGPDGHPRRDKGIFPPVTLPRRMFAASSMTFLAPLKLGYQAELMLSVADVRLKRGKSGDLVLIDVERTLIQEGTAHLRERQTIVYRGAGEPIPPVQCVESIPAANESVWIPDPVELFRFSAVTFNAHRIHYDLGYACQEEGYPALVVHGPLTATRLFGFVESRFGPPRTFQFRALAPLFVGQPVRLVATAEVGRVDALRCDGPVAMSAQWGQP